VGACCNGYITNVEGLVFQFKDAAMAEHRAMELVMIGTDVDDWGELATDGKEATEAEAAAAAAAGVVLGVTEVLKLVGGKHAVVGVVTSVELGANTAAARAPAPAPLPAKAAPSPPSVSPASMPCAAAAPHLAAASGARSGSDGGSASWLVAGRGGRLVSSGATVRRSFGGEHGCTGRGVGQELLWTVEYPDGGSEDLGPAEMRRGLDHFRAFSTGTAEQASAGGGGQGAAVHGEGREHEEEKGLARGEGRSAGCCEAAVSGAVREADDERHAAWHSANDHRDRRG
jgi:hypothetical protein